MIMVRFLTQVISITGYVFRTIVHVVTLCKQQHGMLKFVSSGLRTGNQHRTTLGCKLHGSGAEGVDVGRLELCV